MIRKGPRIHSYGLKSNCLFIKLLLSLLPLVSEKWFAFPPHLPFFLLQEIHFCDSA